MASLPEPFSARYRINRINNPDHPLSREDVVWTLAFVKKKMADGAPDLVGLPQPLLLTKFQSFAEASLLLLKQRGGCGHEADRLRQCLQEVISGLTIESN
ncbi:hypothetical protein [Paenibacillus sacheonensis]|uniref:Uncharacterized protein n=1 Tax=Paenibacillus sacheonensis TaxID=742054 RepID=A0A7X4YRB4_9BACL|nr:hypothetical protein [Paenibacillus sacheonensis]MBM7563564.1 hypothetical protein [Paenibacillus sacheonensis]NBC71137.1 hypothetical protein [Paenibacillus sacheonensis]